jgi:uncharacterized protein (TIGR00369 family)
VPFLDVTGEERVRDWEQGRRLGHAGAQYGIEWVSHEGFEAILQWQTQKRDTMGGPSGRVVHGGLVAFLADNAMGTATLLTCGKDETFATADLHVQLLRGAPMGRLTCRARVSRRTRQVSFCEATVEDSEGRIVAKASATNMILSGTTG